MDVRMPVLDGLQATRAITAMPDPPKVLVLTTFDLDDYVYEALRSGASGFLLKDASAHELAEAVRLVAAGDALLAPGVTRRLIAEFARMGAPRTPSRKQIEGLTDRESEVLALVARGLSNAEIADQLVVAEQTVKTHVSRDPDEARAAGPHPGRGARLRDRPGAPGRLSSSMTRHAPGSGPRLTTERSCWPSGVPASAPGPASGSPSRPAPSSPPITTWSACTPGTSRWYLRLNAGATGAALAAAAR